MKLDKQLLVSALESERECSAKLEQAERIVQAQGELIERIRYIIWRREHTSSTRSALRQLLPFSSKKLHLSENATKSDDASGVSSPKSSSSSSSSISPETKKEESEFRMKRGQP